MQVRITPRGKLGVKILIGFIFALLLIGLGHKSAADSPEGHQPPATVLAQLDWAQNHTKAACHAVWSADDHKADTVAGWDVVCGSENDAVKTFNDGFADSKADDCQQGFQKACGWLATTKR